MAPQTQVKCPQALLMRCRHARLLRTWMHLSAARSKLTAHRPIARTLCTATTHIGAWGFGAVGWPGLTRGPATCLQAASLVLSAAHSMVVQNQRFLEKGVS